MIVNVKIEGTKPLLMHQDNITWSEAVKAWQKHPENKGKSIAGDDRSPAWTWIGGMYHDGKHACIPSDNIMTMLREGGTQVKTGNGKQTYKSQTQSGIIPLDSDWILSNEKGPVKIGSILKLEGDGNFDKHLAACKDLGFDLLVKRAKIGQSKHVRVRPIFRTWKIFGRLEVIDDTITLDVLSLILNVAGRLKGIGDWRPSSKTPGGYGTFISTCEVEK